jgi:hypothetical protein
MRLVRMVNQVWLAIGFAIRTRRMGSQIQVIVRSIPNSHLI